ncbi:hypothetical protein DFQ27_004736 [Actinomortierella ambigua]|uniref:Uncharacterized protein n=1 Tax=Actinomortierella ambigua TaxID=1343610 RepID=A0A9P6U2Z3_9FUNG|nr:hypothetical protein DFQ27_004736 [Actinomortierella ambigua]
MSSAIRSILPRVSMSRIPVAAFVNATAVHPSGYSSMPARSNASTSANVPNSKLDIPKEYLREVKHDDHPPPDEQPLMGLAMSRARSTSSSSSSCYSSSSSSSAPSSDRDHDIPLGTVAAETERQMTQRRREAVSPENVPLSSSSSSSVPEGFEQTVVDQYQAAIGSPPPLSEYASSSTSRLRTGRQRRRELATVLTDRLKYKPEGLSQHAWDAIRAVESHKLLKQDRAPIHALNEEDKADARA